MDIDQTVHIYVIQKLKTRFLMAQFLLQPWHRNSNLAINVCQTMFAALCIRNIQNKNVVEEL